MLKMKRSGDSHYVTDDGKHSIHREVYTPMFWFIREWVDDGVESGWGDAHPADGFETLSEAKIYLGKKIADRRFDEACVKLKKEMAK